MIANSHGTAKRGEKRHWQYVVPLERGKLHGDRLRLNRQRRRLYNWKALSSSFSWVSFLGCLQQCSVLFIKATYSRETRRCGVQREERIVHAFAWFRNWLHQDCSMFNKPLQQKYGRQRKLNYTSIPSAFSLAKKLYLLLKHRNCRVTSILGDPGADSGGEGKSKRAGKYDSPSFSFLRAIFFRPFRLSLAPTICPWVSEDGSRDGSVMCWVFSLGTITWEN